MGDKLAGEDWVEERPAEESQNTWRCCLVRLFTPYATISSLYLVLYDLRCDVSVDLSFWTHVSTPPPPVNVCFTTVTPHHCSRAGWVSCLTICPSFSSSASKMSPRPVCFSNWPLLMKPSAGVQTDTTLSLPDVSSHFKSHTRTALISPCRLLAIMSSPPQGNMPRLARIIGAC